MLETIYTDFTTKLLPKIAEGLVITKDYFTDLFGRYAHFLFIQDLIFTILCFIMFLVGTFMIYKGYKIQKENNYDDMSFPLFLFGGILMVIGIIFSMHNGMNTVKDKYLPEIRVYEELKGYMRNRN